MFLILHTKSHKGSFYLQLSAAGTTSPSAKYDETTIIMATNIIK